MIERKRILITVKTYPHPDPADLERVCTAGMLEDGAFIRLYPVPFRYLPKWQSYAKYQWIQVDVEKHCGQDRRPESYRPDVDSIRLDGPPISTKHAWAARKRIVFKQPVRSMEELYDLQEGQNISLGLVRPRVVEDLLIVPDEEDWKPEWKADLDQFRLDIGPQRLPLEKIPFKFRYRFRCYDERCNGHTMSLGDWEAGVLFLKQRRIRGDAQRAASVVRDKFLGELCSSDKDVHFFVGTVAQFGTWIVLGVFCPPRTSQRPMPLFD
ncbi:MAG: hypothetical protein ABSE56_04165 [Bryobacteraceae bacterium]|jgi:hypothetical protein